MKKMKNGLYLLSWIAVLLVSYNFLIVEKPDRNEENCQSVITKYADVIKWDDNTYKVNVNAEASSVVKGKELGQVQHTVDADSCEDDKWKNGAATALPEGTILYKVENESSESVLFADGKVYQLIQ
ncbi:hypothetical protein [Marinicrinis sediminis]|uniref:Uncharacterized protein n=1 Tax=Marinicrinis sediminis TaxID=1652465 RepID=A0ABW5RCS3_9BACL